MNIESIVQLQNIKTLVVYREIVRQPKGKLLLENINLFHEKFRTNDMVQKAFACNLRISKKGRTQMPYFLHSVRVALLIDELIDDTVDTKEHLLVAALIHDCIEEGDGDPNEIYQGIVNEFPDGSTYPESAWLLMEPFVLAQTNSHFCVKKSVLVRQILESNYSYLINVFIADILDSVICYIYNDLRYKNINAVIGIIMVLLKNNDGLIYPMLREFLYTLLSSEFMWNKINKEDVAKNEMMFKECFVL